MSEKDNLLRLLTPFLRDPTKSFKRKDLSSIFADMSWDLVQKALQNLEKDKILDIEFSRGRPRGGKRTKNYKINGEISTFNKLFQLYYGNNIEELLSSKYANSIIKNFHLEVVYDIIKPKLEVNDFRKIASKTLLNQPSTWDEYNDKGKLINEFLSLYGNRMENNRELEQESIEASSILFNLDQELGSTPIKPIEILSGFDPLHAVRFYRGTLHKSILKAYDQLANEHIITEGFRDFLAFDNYLSPLTAHPSNNLTKILFSNPFQRIYEDAYLLDREAFWVLSGRAAAIYNGFPDFLFECFKSGDLGPAEWEIISKEMIYSWNISSTRFDMVCHNLAELYEKKIGSGNYHLKSDGLNYQIIDLESGSSILHPNISSSLLSYGSIPRIIKQDQNNESLMKAEIMRDPFSFLRPCMTFKDMGWKSELIPIEEILCELKKKMDPSSTTSNS